MTGRKWTFRLYPVSLSELIVNTNIPEVLRSLETRMIYGSYPEVITNPGNEKAILRELVSDYLYKDVFSLKEVRIPDVLEKLLQALAFKTGNQVSNRELSRLIQVDKDTINRYLYLLEEAYIIFRLRSFSRNSRSEIKRSKKVYFYDVGIRNAIINQYSPLALRNDVGALWENLMIVERLKKSEYNSDYCNRYFWRTSRQQEIDYLEEADGKLSAFEFKWSTSKSIRPPVPFIKTYPDAQFKVVTKENFLDFI